MGGSGSLEHRPSCASAVIVGAYGPYVALKMACPCLFLRLPLLLWCFVTPQVSRELLFSIGSCSGLQWGSTLG